jgi:tetratricopeptide (TPR) repeat protein
MATTVRSLDAVRQATVRVCNPEGKHVGQGLLLDLDGEGAVVLTCHHVIARLTPHDLHVSIPSPEGGLAEPVPANYDAERSRPGMDAAVLRIKGAGPNKRPLLHALNPETYSGNLPGYAVCVGHWQTDTFDAQVGTTTKLDVPVEVPGSWPDPPRRYALPAVFRLRSASDTREGISGSVVAYDNGILGLAHFARPEGPAHTREIYLVPISVWSAGWPALASLVEPLVDQRLRNSATVKMAGAINVGTDVLIAGYRSDLYIELDSAARAREAVSKRSGVILVGKPKSGKTRLALNLIQERQNAVVVIPHEPRPPIEFETAGFTGADVVLFFDDLHRTLLSSDPLEWRRRFEDATGKQCVLICTSRDGDDWKMVCKSSTSRVADEMGQDAVVFTSFSEGRGSDLSEGDGLALAAALGMNRREFRKRFDGTPGSLALNLSDMSSRYRRLQDESRDGVSMSRLLDSAKLLYEASQPRMRGRVLRAVAEQIRGTVPTSPETWEALQRRAAEEGFGLINSETDEFQTYRPYLEDCVAYKPSAADIEALKPILIEANDIDGLSYLGKSLLMRFRAPEAAERVLRVATEHGNASAEDMLGWAIAAQSNRAGDAEERYRRNIQAGNVNDYHNLGNLLSKQPGREADAEQAFRDAIRTMSGGERAIASWSLGNLLAHQAARKEDAESAYRDAAEWGLFLGHAALGPFLADQIGREVDAEAALREAIEVLGAQDYDQDAADAGPPPSLPGETLKSDFLGQVYASLGNVLARQKRPEEAEDAYRKGIQLKNHSAAGGLGALLSEDPNRESEAEPLLREAAEAGAAGANVYLARIAGRHPSRVEEAERLLHVAIDAGINAQFDLAVLLATQVGREPEAEPLLHRAIEDGQGEAHLWLGFILARQSGRKPEAEDAFRAAIRYTPEAYRYLGALLSGDPERLAEAEEAYRHAISSGERAASYDLGKILLERLLRGESVAHEAELLFRQAIEDGTDARVELALVLILQPPRYEEGFKLLSDAKDAGLKSADYYLELLAKDARQKKSKRSETKRTQKSTGRSKATKKKT